MNTRIFPSKEECAVSLIHHILSSASLAIHKHGHYWIALSGGSLLKMLSAHLPSSHDTFPLWHVAFADERCVPLDSADSNAGSAMRGVFASRGFQSNQIYSIYGKDGTRRLDLDNPDSVGLQYEAILKEGFSASLTSRPCLSDLPMFDTIVLGLGPDGHTASLFPGHCAYLENLSLVQSIQSARSSFYVASTPVSWIIGVSHSPKPPANRVTISLGVIASAKDVLFYVNGADKADAVRECMQASFDSPKLMDMEWLANLSPASTVNMLRGNSAIWFLDREAASRIK